MVRDFKSAIKLCVCLALCAAGGFALAQEPGPTATPTEKLDYLFKSWRGHSLEDLHDIWGKESSIEQHGDNKVYVFERRVRVRANAFGVAVYGNGGLRCVARFEIDVEGKIVRTSRQGGGKDCWNALRKYEPS